MKIVVCLDEFQNIEREYWVKFIVSKFKKSRNNITENIAGKVADDMENYPYFVQQLSYNLWNNTGKNVL